MILVLHHLTITNLNIKIDTIPIDTYIIKLTKVCVSIFVILSGYGLTKSFEKNNKSNYSFVISHLKRLMINYWWVYIPAFFLSIFMHINGNPFVIYGSGIKGIFNCIMDAMGLRTLLYGPTLNATWWFMELMIIYYLLFPFLYKIVKKIPVEIMILVAIPNILSDFFGIMPSALVCTDREIYCLLSFVIGIYLADKKILDKVVLYCSINNKKKLIILSLCFIICSQFFTLKFITIGNVMYALSIILLGIGLKTSKTNKTIKFIELLGKNSMNIFLVHSFYHGYFAILRRLFEKIPTVILKYISLASISLFTSLLIEKIKKFFIKNNKDKKLIESQNKIEIKKEENKVII